MVEPRRRSARSGFTLMEVLVTVLIMGILLASMTQVLSTTRTARDTIYNIQETHLAGPAIMDLIERDLRGIVTWNTPRTNHISIENRVMLGQDADSIDFVTTTDSLIWNYEREIPVRADVNEVGYRLRPNPESDDFLEIFRREDFGVDEEPFSGGSFSFLHDRVKAFDIRVFAEDGVEAEELDEWNTESSDEEFQGLPAWIEVSLTLELAPRLIREQISIAPVDRRTYTYWRVIRLPEALRGDEREIPRLAIPSTPTGEPAAGPDGQTPDGQSGDPDGQGQGQGQGAGSGQGLGQTNK